MSKIALAIVALLLLILLPAWVFGLFPRLTPDFLPFDPSRGTSISSLFVLALSISMLLGVFFGSIHQKLLRRTGAIDILMTIREVGRDASFWRSLIAAPVVFAGVYSLSINANPDAIVALLFAFQNGFFCEAILRERARSPQSVSKRVVTS